MLKSIRLQNFFGFQDCTINLEKGENVLVGINGSGKSNFFKAVRLLSQGFNSGSVKDLIVEWGGRDRILFMGNDKEKNFRIDYLFDIKAFQEKVSYAVTSKYDFIELSIDCNFVSVGDFELNLKVSAINGNQKRTAFEKTERGATLFYRDNDEGAVSFKVPEGGDFFLPRAEPNSEMDFLWEFCQTILRYDEFDVSEIRYPGIARTIKWLSSNGSDMTQLLHTFKHNHRDTFDNIISALKKVNENFKDIDITVYSSIIEPVLIETGFKKSLPVSNISDGTLRFLCLMTILYNPNRASIICIDEPELGLHPDMINTLHGAIEYAAQTSQIIISTHSPHLLDYFELENVRVFEKDENNSTEINQYTVADFKGWYEQFNPGEMWRAGDIGGNRW